MILTNAVLAKSACQSLIQFADRLFSAIYIIEDCNIHKNPRLYLQLIANHLGFLFEAEFFQPHYFFTNSDNDLFVKLKNLYFSDLLAESSASKLLFVHIVYLDMYNINAIRQQLIISLFLYIFSISAYTANFNIVV